MSTLIAIDPGASGGIAWTHSSGAVWAAKMPDTPKDIYALIGDVALELDTTCVIEDVGYHIKGNNASASCKFARHVGHLEAFLLALEIPTTRVRPAKWQKHFGALPKDKTQRKRKIKELVQQRHPKLKVTLMTSDALGILEWAMEAQKRGEAE